jgi:hypothetical protein
MPALFMYGTNSTDPRLSILPVGGNAGSPSRKDEPMKGDKGTSAGARHGSRDSKAGHGVSGLQERTGEFRVGEKIIFGMRNGNVLIRHSPQGDEVEVGEATLAGLMIDAFFSDKFGGDYPTVKSPTS